MHISLTQDFRTIEELEKDPRSVVDQVHETGRPVVLTRDGKPDLILLDAATYERNLRVKNLKELLEEGEADRAAGRVQSIEDFEAEFFRGKTTSR